MCFVIENFYRVTSREVLPEITQSNQGGRHGEEDE